MAEKMWPFCVSGDAVSVPFNQAPETRLQQRAAEHQLWE